MKIRTGFVSNSSSSSFILALERKPKTVAELQKLLFGNDAMFPHPYQEDEGYPASQVAATVFEDLQQAKKLSLKKIAEEFACGWLNGMPDMGHLFGIKDDDERKKAWDQYYKDREEFALKKAREFVKGNPGCVFFALSYSDNDGSYGSALEHGGTFDRLSHVRISHH